MGCDWYFIKSVGALGFPIDADDYDKYKNVIMNNNCYSSYIFRYDDDTLIFIYDISTISVQELNIPGPYEITEQDTVIQKQQCMTEVLKEKTEEMKKQFNVDCGYHTLLTTETIGEYVSSMFEVYDSIQDYEEACGF